MIQHSWGHFSLKKVPQLVQGSKSLVCSIFRNGFHSFFSDSSPKYPHVLRSRETLLQKHLNRSTEDSLTNIDHQVQSPACFALVWTCILIQLLIYSARSTTPKRKWWKYLAMTTNSQHAGSPRATRRFVVLQMNLWYKKKYVCKQLLEPDSAVDRRQIMHTDFGALIYDIHGRRRLISVLWARIGMTMFRLTVFKYSENYFFSSFLIYSLLFDFWPI